MKFCIRQNTFYVSETLMKAYVDLTLNEKEELLASLNAEYGEYLGRGLALDLSRGKPNSSQLDISQGLLSVELNREDCFAEDGTDCRNYGVLDGLPEMKRFFARVFGIPADIITVGGNSSLQLMYDTLSRAMLFPLPGAQKPWCDLTDKKWICITPGYDRHFRITELFGFELISVPMLSDGPDMDMIEALVKDESVKGIWCVPKYSNPSGNTYSEQTVRRLATMKCAAVDFRIFWDNAYGVHDFGGEGDSLADIFALCREAGNEDRVFCFSSTSKITFPGGGVSMVACSHSNKKWMLPSLGAQTIGYDKLNQLRHLKYFGNAEGLRSHMLKLGEVIGAKFHIALGKLQALNGLGVASWTEPVGGYFISLDCLPGTARRVYELVKRAGVTLTPPGATHPYGVDPEDKTLRIAPTYPSDAELAEAMDVLVLAVRIAALERMLHN